MKLALIVSDKLSALVRGDAAALPLPFLALDLAPPPDLLLPLPPEADVPEVELPKLMALKLGAAKLVLSKVKATAVGASPGSSQGASLPWEAGAAPAQSRVIQM